MALIIPPMIVVVPVTFNRVYTEVSSWQQYAHPVKIAASRPSPSFILKLYSKILQWRNTQMFSFFFPFLTDHDDSTRKQQRSQSLQILSADIPLRQRSQFKSTSSYSLSPQEKEEAIKLKRKFWLEKGIPDIERMKRRQQLSQNQRKFEKQQIIAWHHIVITGNMFSNSDISLGRQLPVMLEHCFLSDRESRYLQLVILNPRDPSKLIEKCVLEHPYYNQRCAWVTGSPYEYLHVGQWAHANSAMAIVITGDTTAAYADFQTEDERTVRQTIAITRMLHGGQDISLVQNNNNKNNNTYDQHIINGTITIEEAEYMRQMHISKPPRVIGCLLRERNAYLLEAETAAGVIVLALDSIKYALLARSIYVPMVHLLLTSLVCKRPHRRLIVDDDKLTPFDAGREVYSTHPPSSPNFARRSNFQRLPSVSSLDRGDSALSSSIRSKQSTGNVASAKNSSSRDENRSRTRPQSTSNIPVSPTRRHFFFQNTPSDENKATDEMKPSFSFDEEDQQRAGSLDESEEDEELLDHTDEEQEQMERDLSASYGLHEIRATLQMCGISFGVLVTAAHEAIKSLACHAGSHGRHLATVLGALPVAVVITTRSAQRRVLNFPSSYKLKFGDSLLVIARSYLDAVAVLDHIDYMVLNEDRRRRSRRRSPTVEGMPACTIDEKNACVEKLHARATFAMGQVGAIGLKPAERRKAYMTKWAKLHVVSEVPTALYNHVVLCAPVGHGPYFLQPLLVAKSIDDQKFDGPPDVVILDNMNVEDESNLSRKFMQKLENLVFYDPLPPLLDPDQESAFEGDDDYSNSLISTQRLWIVLGDPCERPRRFRPSGFPSTLERAGVERCSHFVLPRVNTTFRDKYDEGFLEDDYNSKVARNVDALTSAYAAKAAAAVPSLPPPGRRRSYVIGRQHRPPHVLVEVEEVAKVRDFLTIQSYNHEENTEHLIVGAFGEAASRDTRCEVFSPRILHALPVVVACDSDAILHFTKHAVCAFSKTGELPTVELDDGRTIESCCLICYPIPGHFHNRNYSSFLKHCVFHGCLPIAMCRKSNKGHSDNFESRNDHNSDDDTNKSEESLNEKKSDFTKTFTAVQHQLSKSHHTPHIPSVMNIYNRLTHSESHHQLHNHEEEYHDVVEDDSHQPYYIYVNPLPGDVIRRHDKVYLLVNSYSTLSGSPFHSTSYTPV
eukprot:CAMPEP_0197323808 /NCGR_PEP_ID=MMETSP0891-20130614/70744_1 /TAXON_ID=44058 ORGANISM="Aureoumbra lagunensis, Strain CCMP1510" /NCGR_SAMPLE_ID=MMETSP0891 /ASSEMBLY_ACC=CAM_ASM_000534 /LENGTH=1179 /DNA_ID=CAMNT_0042816527 /DNA_START=648 /DNA_END=4187 /DNA_ORIENTATION=+